jgi:hypothetical protein
MPEFDITLVVIMFIFTCACVYFNWRGGYRHGVIVGGSAFYDHAVRDTISYLIEAKELSPHWRHHIDQILIDNIANQGAIDRGLNSKKPVEKLG